VRIDRKVFVPGSDGTRLAVTLYLPDASGDGPFPAVLESLPYRKDDDCTARDWATYAYLASRGIAGIRLDIRGTGASSGVIEDEYLAVEQADNLAVMEWAAAQEWCSGALGMWGISWGGFSALQTAMLQPSRLKAIAPMHATHDRFACDVHYLGGSLHAQEQVDWPPSMIACNALPPDPDIFGEDWYEEWMKRLEATPQWPLEWLAHQRRDGYWRHGSPAADYSAIRCPTLLIGGWLDGYVDGMLALAENLTCPTRLVVGPWGHHRPADGVPAPTLDHFELLARWFGHHLRGDDNGIMEDLAPATLFVHTEPSNDTVRVPGRWRSEPAWPPPDCEWQIYSLTDLSHGPTDWNGPQWVGAHAPAWDRAGVEVTSSDPDDAAAMVFEGDPLPHPLEILGSPVVEIRVSSDTGSGLAAARLLAVAPDERTFLLARGSRNLAFPADLSDPQPVIPGEQRTLEIVLLACSATIPAGWRLRLSLAGADFPLVWPPGERFTLRVDPGGSTLRLPSVPIRPEGRWLDLPEAGEVPEPPVVEQRSVSERQVVRAGDVTSARRVIGHTEHQPTRGDLSYAMDQEWTVTVPDHDPAATAVESTCRMSLERPGWSVETTGRLRITSDPSAFHVEIDLSASHGSREVFARTWRRTIPREWA
jgi:uncharacterized protein